MALGYRVLTYVKTRLKRTTFILSVSCFPTSYSIPVVWPLFPLTLVNWYSYILWPHLQMSLFFPSWIWENKNFPPLPSQTICKASTSSLQVNFISTTSSWKNFGEQQCSVMCTSAILSRSEVFLRGFSVLSGDVLVSEHCSHVWYSPCQGYVLVGVRNNSGQ